MRLQCVKLAMLGRFGHLVLAATSNPAHFSKDQRQRDRNFVVDSLG